MRTSLLYLALSKECDFQFLCSGGLSRTKKAGRKSDYHQMYTVNWIGKAGLLL